MHWYATTADDSGEGECFPEPVLLQVGVQLGICIIFSKYYFELGILPDPGTEN